MADKRKFGENIAAYGLIGKKYWVGDKIRVVTGQHAGKEGYVVNQGEQERDVYGRFLSYKYVYIWVTKFDMKFRPRNDGTKVHVKDIEMIELGKYHRTWIRIWERRAEEEAKRPTKIRYPVEDIDENGSPTNEDH